MFDCANRGRRAVPDTDVRWVSVARCLVSGARNAVRATVLKHAIQDQDELQAVVNALLLFAQAQDPERCCILRAASAMRCALEMVVP